MTVAEYTKLLFLKDGVDCCGCMGRHLYALTVRCCEENSQFLSKSNVIDESEKIDNVLLRHNQATVFLSVAMIAAISSMLVQKRVGSYCNV